MTPRAQQDDEKLLAHSSAVQAFGPVPEAPTSGGALPPALGARGGSAGCGRWGQRLTLSSQRNPHWGRSTQTLEELPSEKPLEGMAPGMLHMRSAVSRPAADMSFSWAADVFKTAVGLLSTPTLVSSLTEVCSSRLKLAGEWSISEARALCRG